MNTIVIPKESKKVLIEEFKENNSSKKYIIEDNVNSIIILLITQSIKSTIEVVFSGQGSSVAILGVIFGKDTQIVDLRTVQDHMVPHTTSDLLIKTVLTDNAQFLYEGLIKVEKNAQQTNAYQRNDNLILSDNAHVETKPALEILADDVRCTHGATIGKLDSEQLFYLKSRGIKQEESERLIVSGFLTSVFERITDKKIREEVIGKVQNYF